MRGAPLAAAAAAGRASNPAGKRSTAPPAAIVDHTALGPAQSQTREVRGVRLAPGRGGILARQHVERTEHPFILVQDKVGRHKPLFHEFRPEDQGRLLDGADADARPTRRHAWRPPHHVRVRRARAQAEGEAQGGARGRRRRRAAAQGAAAGEAGARRAAGRQRRRLVEPGGAGDMGGDRRRDPKDRN